MIKQITMKKQKKQQQQHDSKMERYLKMWIMGKSISIDSKAITIAILM